MSIFIYYECKRIINKNTNIVCLYKREYIFIQFSKHDKMHMEIHILQNIMCKNAHKLNARRTEKGGDCNYQSRKIRILYPISKQIHSRKYQNPIWSK